MSRPELSGFLPLEPSGYLKRYGLTYRTDGEEKRYEIVSRHAYSAAEELGQAVDGVCMVVLQKNRLLLLKEFRLGINRAIYNLCAGMIRPGETMEDCCRRELMEETGLSLVRLIRLFPPSFSAVAISDVRMQVALVEAKGKPGASDSAWESIESRFFTKKQVEKLLLKEEFSSWAQFTAFCFTRGGFDGL